MCYRLRTSEIFHTSECSMNAKCYSHLLSTPFQNEGVIGFKENYCTIEGISYFNRELEKRLCAEHLLNCLLIFRILKYLQMTILLWPVVVRNKLLITLFPQPWMNKCNCLVSGSSFCSNWLFCNMRHDRHNELSVYLSFYLLLSMSNFYFYFPSSNNFRINFINTFHLIIVFELM